MNTDLGPAKAGTPNGELNYETLETLENFYAEPEGGVEPVGEAESNAAG
jgi:hypothetical protein